MKMQPEHIKEALGVYNIRVDVRPTKSLFPHIEIEDNHYSIVCENTDDQQRVHHWIQFMKPTFDHFNVWAAYIEAIVENN